LTQKQTSLERALEEAVSRALRDNLAPLQRTADELHQAYSDLVASCASTRPSNALPAMLRAQTAASALAAGLSVLSNFVAVALNPRDVPGASASASAAAIAESESEAAPEIAPAAPSRVHETVLEVPPTPVVEEVAEKEIELAPITPEIEDKIEEPAPAPVPEAEREAAIEVEPVPAVEPVPTVDEHIVEVPAHIAAPAAAEVQAFDIAALPAELQDLHRRANRVAKVAMQDIKLLRPKDVQTGREHNDLCVRLRADLDKARKEYDRRFRAISDHPVDYFHHWALEILAGGDRTALGEYPYPSPVLRH
jgi:hypothetical protein